MSKEIYVDGIGNISVQGPVVTLSFVRSNLSGGEDTERKDQEVLQLTMTGQNLVKVTNILSNTLKRLAEKSRDAGAASKQDKSGSKANPPQKLKKDQTVN